MSGWLLDTNVISELRKPHCDPHVKAWSDAQAPVSLYLSRITIAEIRFGIERLPPDDPVRTNLATWLDTRLRPWFADRILEIDEGVILIWRRMIARGKVRNYTFPQPPLFIAATAAVHGLCVVTRNIDGFAMAGVAVLNPWTDKAPRLPA